jgi:hypothetical protein
MSLFDWPITYKNKKKFKIKLLKTPQYKIFTPKQKKHRNLNIGPT